MRGFRDEEISFASTHLRVALQVNWQLPVSDEATADDICDRLRPAPNSELRVEVGEMGLDGARADEQDVGDFRVGEPTRQDVQNLQLALCET